MQPAVYGWNACCTLNLLATDRADEILRSLGGPSYIVKDVLEAEVLTLRALPEDDATQPLVPADLSSITSPAGAMQLVDLTSEEQRTLIRFAEEMDDGEARTAALAQHRGLCLVSDDRVSVRVAAAHAIPTLATPEWVKRWADSTGASATVLRDCLYRIEARAHYRPRRVHPFYAWWIAAV